MESFKVFSQILKQYKELTCREEKLFYYAYGKFYMKAKAIENEFENSGFENFDLESYTDFKVNIDYDEIKSLAGVVRVDKNNFKEIEKNLIKGSNSVSYYDDNGDLKVVFIYKNITFDNKSRKVKVEFNPDIEEIFDLCEKKDYTRVLMKDIENLKNTYDLKFYLYCLTIMRKDEGSGVIRVKIENLRQILDPNSSMNDNSFIFRFISEPIRRINNNPNLSMYINFKREKDIALINVFDKKRGENNENKKPR